MLADGFRQPSLALAKRDRLHLSLAGRIDPTQNDAIDADAIETMRVRRIFGEPGQRRLGRGIDRKLRRSAPRVHGEDIDDRARRLALAQVIDEPLHEKEWRSRVDREEPVPEFHVRFGERPPVSQGGGIHQGVDMTEALERRVEDQIRRIGLFEIRRHKQGGRPASLELSRRGRAFVPVASRHHETFGAGAGDRLGDRQAHALG